MAFFAPNFRGGRLGQLTSPRQLAAPSTAAAHDAEVQNKSAADIERQLLSILSQTYKPQLPIYSFRDENFDQISFYYDIESMLKHDCISTPLEYVKAPISQMQIEVKASSAKVVTFVVEEWRKFQQNWLPRVQDSGYPYGWAGAEPVYDVEGGLLVQTDLRDFMPRDTQPLIQGNNVVGVQLNNVGGGSIRLENVPGCPAKGFWYAHRPRYGSHYGQSQIRSAWKPWRRLTGRDGVEEVTDLDCYRSGTGVVVVGAPMEDQKAKHQAVGNQERQAARDAAQELAENLKAGAGIVIPTTQYPNGGGAKWTLDFESPQSNIKNLLDADKALYEKCSKAIGFPPEIIEAADTGSGFSGRLIPLQAFLMCQQHVAQGLFFAWWTQIGRPLVWWNFGKHAWARPNVVDLLKSYRQAQQQASAPPPPPAAAAAAPPSSPPSGPPAVGTTAPTPSGQPGKVPYLGPRGGKGFRDAQGRVHYAAMFSTEAGQIAARAIQGGLEGRDPKKWLLKLAKTMPDLSTDEIDNLLAAISQQQAAVDEDDEPITTLATAEPERADSARELRQMMEAMARKIENLEGRQQQPVINLTSPPANVHVDAPVVNVHPPEIRMEAAKAPDVHIHPQQIKVEAAKAPDVKVHVDAPPPAVVNVSTPDVKVHVDAPPPAVVNVQAPPPAQVTVNPPAVTVNMPTERTVTKTVKDKDGKVTHTLTETRE